jgi:hypothetical protein
LEVLTVAEVAQYLGERFAGCVVPVALVRLVSQRTDGNPLFLVTLVDYLMRQGWWSRRQAGWPSWASWQCLPAQCRTAYGSSSSCNWGS